MAKLMWARWADVWTSSLEGMIMQEKSVVLSQLVLRSQQCGYRSIFQEGNMLQKANDKLMWKCGDYPSVLEFQYEGIE